MENIRYGYNYETRFRRKSTRLTKSIDCSGNYIYKIENLEEGLENLICSFNNISRINNLPTTLKTLDISHNRLRELENLHEGLLMIDCRYNNIKQVTNIPKSLIYFYCNWNKVKKIDNVEKSRLNFDYDNNKFIKQYHMIRKIQIKMKNRYKKRERAARIIQNGMEDWLWKPKCKDNTKGINLRLLLHKCEDLIKKA